MPKTLQKIRHDVQEETWISVFNPLAIGGGTAFTIKKDDDNGAPIANFPIPGGGETYKEKQEVRAKIAAQAPSLLDSAHDYKNFIEFVLGCDELWEKCPDWMSKPSLEIDLKRIEKRIAKAIK